MAEMDLLKTFLVVYRTGTFTQAARQLHMSQPAVSMQIRSLERAIGKPLFRRQPRGVEATAGGHELAHVVGVHVDALAAAMDASSDAGGAVGSSVHVGGPEEFMTIRVVPELAPLVMMGLRTRMFFDVDAPIVEQLMAGELDLAVTTDEWRRRGLESERLCYEYLDLVAAPAWAEHLGHVPPDSTGARAISEVPVAAYDEELPLIRTYWQTVFGGTSKLHAPVVANSLRATMAFAVQGAGMTVLPAHVAKSAIERGDLIRLVVPAEAPRNQLHLAWRSGGLRRSPVARVHERIRSAARAW